MRKCFILLMGKVIDNKTSLPKITDPEVRVVEVLALR